MDKIDKMKRNINPSLAGIGLVLCLIAGLILFLSCDDKLDIRNIYGYELETMPIPKKIKIGETVEIRCQLIREGKYDKTRFYIRYFQVDGKGELKMDNGTVFQPNDIYPLDRETFRLYYTSLGSESHTVDVYILDNHDQIIQRSFTWQHESE